MVSIALTIPPRMVSIALLVFEPTSSILWFLILGTSTALDCLCSNVCSVCHQHDLSLKSPSCALPSRFQSPDHFSKQPPCNCSRQGSWQHTPEFLTAKLLIDTSYCIIQRLDLKYFLLNSDIVNSQWYWSSDSVLCRKFHCFPAEINPYLFLQCLK